MLGYCKVNYSKGAREAQFFTNFLDGDATNLLARGPTGEFLPLDFNTKTFDIEVGDTHASRRSTSLTYGGNFRYNTST